MSADRRQPTTRRQCLDDALVELRARSKDPALFPEVPVEAVQLFSLLMESDEGVSVVDLCRRMRSDPPSVRRACQYLACVLLVYARAPAGSRVRLARIRRRQAGVPAAVVTLYHLTVE